MIASKEERIQMLQIVFDNVVREKEDAALDAAQEEVSRQEEVGLLQDMVKQQDKEIQKLKENIRQVNSLSEMTKKQETKIQEMNVRLEEVKHLQEKLNRQELVLKEKDDRINKLEADVQKQKEETPQTVANALSVVPYKANNEDVTSLEKQLTAALREISDMEQLISNRNNHYWHELGARNFEIFSCRRQLAEMAEDIEKNFQLINSYRQETIELRAVLDENRAEL